MDNTQLLIVLKGALSPVYYIGMNCSHLGRDAMTNDDKIPEERQKDRQGSQEATHAQNPR